MEFFVTFGQRYAREQHPTIEQAHPDGWLVIEADSWEEARAVAARELGTSWSDLVSKDDFMKDAERLYPKGEIGRITSAANAG